MRIPQLPPLSDEATASLAALVRSGDAYRRMLFVILDWHPEFVPDVLEREDILGLADQTINAWRDALGLDAEITPDNLRSRLSD